MNVDEAWRPRFGQTTKPGHYESWFLRANHADTPLAFWIRYTIFQPKDGTAAEGELWAVVFDGDGVVTAAKENVPIDRCSFGVEQKIGEATLQRGQARGQTRTKETVIEWDLTWSGDEHPLLLLDEALYDKPLPKAKALVTLPMARFFGSLVVNGETLNIDDWVGSENHNWGAKHTDRYAWGQVAGFDESPDAFLEMSTAQVDIGPIRSPWLTPIVLRLDGQEYAINTIMRAIRNRGQYDVETLRWTFSGNTGGPGERWENEPKAAHRHPLFAACLSGFDRIGRIRRTLFGKSGEFGHSRASAANSVDLVIEGTVSAPRSAFVGLPYRNPVGGTKLCLNTKIAQCSLRVTLNGETRHLHSSRAAFEILTDPPVSQIPILDV